MDNLFRLHRKRAVLAIAAKMKNLFYDSIAECRADLIKDVKGHWGSDGLRQAREVVVGWEKEVEADLKTQTFRAKEKVTANVQPTNIDMMRLAVAAFKAGNVEEAKTIFCSAAESTQDLMLDNLPKSPLITNKCHECGSTLPQIANFCPICGCKLNNSRALTDTLQPQPPPETQLIQVQPSEPGALPQSDPSNIVVLPMMNLNRMVGKLASKHPDLASKLNAHINSVEMSHK